MHDLKIPSQKYPNLHYVGKEDPLYEFSLRPDDENLFLLHLFDDVAKNKEAVERTGHFLDRLEDIDTIARKTLEQAMAEEDHPDHETVKYFIDFYFEGDFSEDELKELLGTKKDPHSLSHVELLQFLGLKKMFTFLCEEETESENSNRPLKQFFSIDYMFNKDMTDGILTLKLDDNFKIVSIDIES